MGCTNSKPAASSAVQHVKKNSKKAYELVDNSHDISDSERHKIKEDIMQRHDTEVDILLQVSAEREALKSVCSVKIERKLSCEDLLDSLSMYDLQDIQDCHHHRKMFRKIRLETCKQELQDNNKDWFIYNNVHALSEDDLSMIAMFMMNFLRGIRSKNLENATNVVNVTTPSTPADNSDSSTKNNSIDIQSYSSTLSIQPMDILTAKAKFKLKHKDIGEILSQLKIVNLVPSSFYQLSTNNLYEYELPSGIVTIVEAKQVIELFRHGGRLKIQSVHKLLRLAYRMLKKRKNITYVDVVEGQKLSIVGDIHGQLADLLHIIDANGMPNPNNKYIFNGDFVDRGECGVEVMCILLALFVARPDCVILNRGNHEDFAICSVYGFQMECYEKYDPITFGLFVEVFQQIPLFAIVNSALFVVHGGLFHHDNITLAELEQIRRTQFSLEDIIEGDGIEPIPRDNKVNFLKQLVRDALWSDPIDYKGIHPSVRGAGVAFGPDITKRFLDTNELSMVIRSHECVRSGYEEPYTNYGDNASAYLCTIFSASDYGGSGNSAAYLEVRVLNEEFSPRERSNSTIPRKNSNPLPDDPQDNISEVKRIRNTQIGYRVHYFYATPIKFSTSFSPESSSGKSHDLTLLMQSPPVESEKYGLPIEDYPESQKGSESPVRASLYPPKPPELLLPTGDLSSPNGIKHSSSIYKFTTPRHTPFRLNSPLIGMNYTIKELIYSNKHAIIERCERIDVNRVQAIPLSEWGNIINELFQLSLSWKKFSKYLIPPDCKVVFSDDMMTTYFKYMEFLAFYEDDAVKLLTERQEAIKNSNIQAYMQLVNDLKQQEENDHSPSGSAQELFPKMTNETNESSSQKTNPIREAALLERYYGYKIPEQIVATLYTNYKQLEISFKYLDLDQDGFITVEDIRRVCDEFDILGKFPYSFTPEAIFSLLDIEQANEINLNTFNEIFRLSVLNAFYTDETATNLTASSRPMLIRETSFATELHRLSHAYSMISPGSLPHAVGSHGSMNHFNHPTQHQLTSIELKKGMEIGVDIELASGNQHQSEDVGLTYDV